ncbi:tryptophan halogenase family protein [Thalassotalea atypica]|uniref:tryptophan halogenase family protein n=1 Tax=Thalassotalea atypica TaxID=2054316 RepID=UPI0025726B95|nr:tryptophan halogenase family protein [Thalassotalea atypica]
MNNPLKKIVILGGGTAGWLTAGIIAAEHNAHLAQGIEITLIESKNIKTIGVGEGTWPTMRETLSTIGISEKEFISCCNASFKQGSQFVGWNTGEVHDSYYHPFIAPHGFGASNQVDYWHAKHQTTPFAHALSFQPHLCDRGKAPKQIQTPEFAAVANYGYHLDAGKFAALLTKHCTTKLGVKHILDDVQSIVGDKSEKIEALITKEHGKVGADLFIDCSGMNGLLINKHYHIPLIKQKNILFNDCALAVQVPYFDGEQENPQAKIASHTISTAHDAGWFWDIGLPARRGIGCVYSSEHMNEEAAAKALHQHLSSFMPTKHIDTLSIKSLKFTPGYRETLWHKNCVAVGMAAGFIEPLEASAIALVELAAKMIAKELPTDTAIMATTAKRFNDRFSYRWQRVIEFLKLHYVLSQRTSDYWQDNRAASSIPSRLQELLELWAYQPPSYNDFTQIEEVFPAASYQYILYGMGFHTQARVTQSRLNNELLSEKHFKENQSLTQKYLAGLPTNRELINYLVSQFKQQKAS